MENILKKISGASSATEAVDIYQASAWEMDYSRPPMAGFFHAEKLPKRWEGADWVWVRIQTQGTGNGGRWVATLPLSEKGRIMKSVLMVTLARLLSGFNVTFLARHPLFWERPVMEWLDSISPELARMLGEQPSVKSRRQAANLEWKGFPLPQTSVPRMSAAIEMAAKAAIAGR